MLDDKSCRRYSAYCSPQSFGGGAVVVVCVTGAGGTAVKVCTVVAEAGGAVTCVIGVRVVVTADVAEAVVCRVVAAEVVVETADEAETVTVCRFCWGGGAGAEPSESEAISTTMPIAAAEQSSGISHFR